VLSQSTPHHVEALTPLEQAIGTPLGVEQLLTPLELDSSESPWEALVERFSPLLARPPLLLAFSGGRDSSLLLAGAADCSQRHGLPPPVAITYRNAGAPGMEEETWQQLVLERFQVQDWVHVDGLGELDFLGPIAREALMLHGARFTPNAHLVVPLARHARARTLVVGLGGDELLAGWRWNKRADVRAGRLRPGVSNLGTLLLGALPSATRRLLFRRRTDSLDSPWLTTHAKRLLATPAAELEDQPTRWDRFVDWSIQRRRLTETLRTLVSLTQGEGAQRSTPASHDNVHDHEDYQDYTWGTDFNPLQHPPPMEHFDAGARGSRR
jgi:Asparagine synthase